MIKELGGALNFEGGYPDAQGQERRPLQKRRSLRLWNAKCFFIMGKTQDSTAQWNLKSRRRHIENFGDVYPK